MKVKHWRAPLHEHLWRTDPAFQRSPWGFLIMSGKGILGNNFSPFSHWQCKCHDASTKCTECYTNIYQTFLIGTEHLDEYCFAFSVLGGVILLTCWSEHNLKYLPPASNDNITIITSLNDSQTSLLLHPIRFNRLSNTCGITDISLCTQMWVSFIKYTAKLKILAKVRGSDKWVEPGGYLPAPATGSEIKKIILILH